MRPPLLALALLLTAFQVSAHNTEATAPLRVLSEGKARIGKPRWRDDRLDLRGRGKFRYAAIQRLEDPFPPSEEHQALLRAEHAKRAGACKAAKDWAKLGSWADDVGLFTEAEAAYTKAIGLDPEQAEARAGLGFLRVGSTWKETKVALAEERAALQRHKGKKLLEGLLELSRRAARNGERGAGLALLLDAFRVDPQSKQALKQLRPLAERYVHAVELSFPLRGRWKASEDPTRHHQLGASSLYALDLLRVDVNGRHFSEGQRFDLPGHFAYGQPFYAAAPGRVVLVRREHPDLPVGKLGSHETSNLVVLDHGGGERTWYVHAQPGTITVAKGDDVKRGHLLGKVGNSGKSSIPHLHFALTLHGFLSVPWRVKGLELVAPEGTKIPLGPVCPREGWTVVAPEPEEPEPKPKEPERR